MSAGVRNVYMYNIDIKRCLSAIYFKSNLDRGGFIRNVHVSNVHCDTAKSAFIRFENNYHGSRGGHYPTKFDGFVIQDVICNTAGEAGIYAVGIKGNPLRNIVLKNVRILKTPIAQVIANAENLSYSNVTVNGKLLDKPVITGPVTLHTD
jgi:polygalacturonase